MKERIEYREARDLLLELAQVCRKERVPLEQSGGRILAGQLTAAENVPLFDRSPYDGYAFRAEDTQNASKEQPVTLRILEEVPAGSVPSQTLQPGTAVKILTGAPIPEGADAVEMYEKTVFTENTVTLSGHYRPGENIIYAGEDVKEGDVLASAGTVIDAGLAGSLAAQGILYPEVFRKPLVGLISTGSELADLIVKDSSESPEETIPQDGAGEMTRQKLSAGMIRNTNRYSLAAALQKDGCDTVYLGTVGDHAAEIADLIRNGIDSLHCDMILLTGGVSAGDYDLTPDAMEQAGCELLVKGVGIKPGMACCYGVKEGKLVCGLSGNPSSSLVNYCSVVRPAVRKMAGLLPYLPQEFTVILADAFSKKSKGTRFLKGRLEIEDGKAVMHIPEGQGNVMIGSFTGCNIMAIVPAGSGPLEAGTQLTGFLI